MRWRRGRQWQRGAMSDIWYKVIVLYLQYLQYLKYLSCTSFNYNINSHWMTRPCIQTTRWCTARKAKPNLKNTVWYCLMLCLVGIVNCLVLLGLAFGLALCLYWVLCTIPNSTQCTVWYCLVLCLVLCLVWFGIVYCLVLLGIVFGLVFSLVSWYCELFSIAFGSVFVQSSHQWQPFCGSLERMVNIYITGENLMADLTSVWKLY